MDYRKLNNIIGWMVFIAATTVYVLTIEPTVSLWDCGEYITTAYKLEVGHPPGAPLFMMLGRLFSMFAEPESAAYMINIMSGLCSSFSVLFLFWTITMLAKRTILSPVVSIFNQKKGSEETEIDVVEKEAPKTLTEGQKWAILGSGVIGGLAYTFSDSAWFSAVEGEVYSMSSFFTAIVIWAIFKWDADLGKAEENADDPDLEGKNPDRWLVFIFLMIGLSIGVHLLNLLCIPAIAYVWYFRKYKKTTALGFILTGVIGVGALGFIQAVLIPKTVHIAAWFEKTFTNSFGAPFNTGTIFFFLLILGLIVFALLWSKKNLKPMLNTIVWSISMIFVGYSCFAMIVIRSNANTPLDENDPENLVTLVSYLEREQYGDWPILYGQYFNSELLPRSEWEDMSDIYLRRFVVQSKTGNDVKGFKTKEAADEYVSINGGTIVQKYFRTYVGENEKPTYDPAECTFFPRMYSAEARHVNGYKSWSGHKGDRLPTMGENLSYFLSYQVDWMYWRYFMWNFTGRQSDEQGHGNAAHGNWMTGLNFIDKHHIGDQTKVPSVIADNPSHNKYYMLPLILGLMGFIFMLNKSTKGWWIVMLLFLLTGFAIIIYLNQKPIEPRERDYAYAGSFYAFSMWIGMSVLALYDAYKHMVWKELGVIVGAMVGLGLVFSISDTTASVSMMYIAAVIAGSFGLMIGLRNAVKNGKHAAILATCMCLPVPMIMGNQGWDDHDRSGRYTAQALPENYLASCDENSIIFTNGDNDTFPLWYLQEVEGKGTDVRVCNLSLLNTDWYTEQMTRKAYDSDPLPIQFTEEQYRQHGYRDFLVVLGTNELTMRDPKITEKWKTILDMKIQENPVEFAEGYKIAAQGLAATLAQSKFVEKQPDLMSKIPGMDTTNTYYEFRNLVFNLLQKGQTDYELVEDQLIAIQDIMLKFNDSFDYVDAKWAMAYLRDDANLEDRGNGRLMFFLPSKGLKVKVDKEKCLANGIVAEKDKDRMQDYIKWKIPKQNIFKADLMILDIVAHFDWDRAVYFASSAERSTYMGLHGHFYSEGLVYKLVPFEVEPNRNPNSLGEVNQDKMYENLMTTFKWGNMDKDGILVDYYTRRLTNNYRVQFSVLADAYVEDIEQTEQKLNIMKQIQENPESVPDTMTVIETPAGNIEIKNLTGQIAQAEALIEETKVKINAVLDKSFEVMPHKNVPFGKVIPSYINSYYMAGNEEKAEQYTNQLFDLMVEEIDYYLSLEPEFSGQEALIDELFGAYRGIFSLYQTSQVYSTNEEHQAILDTRWREKTCEICTALNDIRRAGPAARQQVAATFETFFQRIGWDCNVDCLFGGATPPPTDAGGAGVQPPAIPGM